MPPNLQGTPAAGTGDAKRAAEPRPHARSLNLANAASIALYEAYRQIGGARG